MPNNRIFYAIQVVKMRPCKTLANGTVQYGTAKVLRGVQSVGMTTNFNLEQAYQLGQLEIYDNIEEVPDVEVTLNKVLDGTRALYNIATDGNTANGGSDLALTEIADRRCDLALGIYDDTDVATTGSATYYVVCTGMYVSNVSYNFSTDGNFTEDLTLVGNHKKWTNTEGNGIVDFTSGINPVSTNPFVAETKKVHRRWSLDRANTVLPTGSGGIPGAWGVGSDLHVNSISVSCNLGRESINELGQRSPYYRYVTFPVEVTSEIEVTATRGDQVDADDFSTDPPCSTRNNLVDLPLKIVVCPMNGNGTGYTIDLGAKNKLTSVNYSGGDTGGGNATVTYSFQTFNSFKVSSPS